MRTDREDVAPRPGPSTHVVQQALAQVHLACSNHLKDPRLFEAAIWDPFLSLEADLGLWLTALEDRPEVAQYRTAHRDLGLGFYSACSGLYRQAFSSLRAFLEVSMAAIRFSAAELERRQWVSGRRDVSWTDVTSVDTGLYSVAYLREFMPDALDEREEILSDAKLAYRRCSEYLHGNVATSALLPEGVQYAPGVVDEWRSMSVKALRALHHSFFVRYFNDLTMHSKARIEPALEQHFAHLKSVRLALGLPVEESI
jgi:hypothetical protein